MNYNIISADSHMDLGYVPPDAFISRVPDQWKDRVPKVIETPEGPEWVAGDQKLGPYGYTFQRGPMRGVRGKAMAEAGFEQEDCRPSNPIHRIEDQEKDGVDAEVIYGIFRLQDKLKDLDAAAVSFSAYNQYIAEFCSSNPERLFGLGCIPCNNVESAVNETKHCAQLGLKGAEWSYLDASKPLWHPHWEPMWEAAAEHNVVISLHVRAGTTTVGLPGMVPGLEDHPASLAAALAVSPMQLDEALASIIYCGALERHPNLKIVLAESGIGWIPYVLDRMDYEWEDNYDRFTNLINTKPSDLFRRQVYATFQKDAVGPLLAGQFCPDNFMWGSDYPHPDGVWPDSQKTIQQYMGQIDKELRRKITRDNVAALYGIRLD